MYTIACFFCTGVYDAYYFYLLYMKNRPIIIAEIGCNHKGDMVIAKQLIKEAKDFCGADVVKFQKRNPRELLTEEEYNSPHPNPENAYGDTYGAHREFLEFTTEQHQELKDYCDSIGIEYSTSVWDTGSAKDIVPLKPAMLKIPSACNTDYELLEHLAETYDGEIHVSLGMTTREEERELIDFLKNKGIAERTVLYSCTSGYPVPFEEVYLLEIVRLNEAYGDVVKAIGFSGHHLGIAADVAAMTLGAEYIERHFTLDRTWKGTDHAASLEPAGLRKLVRDIHNVHQALAHKDKEISMVEEPQRKKLKRLKKKKVAK